jgi:hypothetical protein
MSIHPIDCTERLENMTNLQSAIRWILTLGIAFTAVELPAYGQGRVLGRLRHAREVDLTAFAGAEEKKDGKFSFGVYGDSRSMMYLPYKLDQKEEAIKLMTDMFELVLPEKVAAEVVKKDVKLIYDPTTKELVQIVMPFDTRSEVTTLTLDKGWVTEASVEDVKLLPGVRRTMFRLHGVNPTFEPPGAK